MSGKPPKNPEETWPTVFPEMAVSEFTSEHTGAQSPFRSSTFGTRIPAAPTVRTAESGLRHDYSGQCVHQPRRMATGAHRRTTADPAASVSKVE